MKNYYQQFSEVDEFNSASTEDKFKFGNLYADQVIASDERFDQNPELGEFLRKQITEDIQKNLTLPEPQQTFEQFGENVRTILGEGVGEDVVQTIGGIKSDINAITTRGFKENLGALGENTANVLLHTAGIPGRLLAGMAQLPHALASTVMEKVGLGDSPANQWVKAQYAGLERDKQLMTVYQNALTQYEPDVLGAGLVGAGFGAGIHAFQHRALNGAAKLVGAAEFTATDAAIVNGWTTAVGEAAVVSPALRVSEHYINESGYTEETKNVLRATLPIMLGIISGTTLEAKLDKVLGNPLAVDSIVSGAKKGLGPVELGEQVRTIVKAPSLVEEVAKNTNGRVPRESLATYGKDFNIEAGFRHGPEFPPIVVEAYKVEPRQLAKAAGLEEQAATMKSIPDAINHLVKVPMDTARMLSDKIKTLDPIKDAEKIAKFGARADKDSATALAHAQALRGNFSKEVDNLVINALQGKPLDAIPITKADMLKSDAFEAGETQNFIAELITKSGDVDELTAKNNYMDAVTKAYKDNIISLDDARRATALADDSSKGWLFGAERKTIINELDKIGINGQNNGSLGEWTFAHLNNEGGYVDPQFAKTVMLHSLPLITGLEVRDGELTWNANKYLKYGALWHVLGFGGKAYRRIGGNKIIYSVGSKISKKFWQVVDHPALKGIGKPLHTLRPTEGIDPEIYGIKKAFRRQKQQLRRQLDEFAIGLKKNYNDQELEMLSDFIEKEGDWAGVPRLLQEQASEIQGFLKQTQERLIDSGIDPELIDELGENYLHRVYVPQLLKKPTYKMVKAKLKAIQANYLKRRGKNADMKKKLEQMELTEADFTKGDKVYYGVGPDAKKIWVHENQVVKLKELKAKGPVTEWNIVEVGKKIVANTDYTKAEREAMGESRDVALRLAVFFRETSHDIALGRVFQEVEANERLTLKNADELSQRKFRQFAKEQGFVQLPDKYTPSGVARYGKLNGQWVHPDVERVLSNMTNKRYDAQWKETVAFLNRTALTTWKVAKTAYNPGTHATNIITNFHLAAMDGRNPIWVAKDGIQTLATKDKFFREAIDAGLIDSGVLAGEWNLKQFQSAAIKLRAVPEDYPLAMKAMVKAYGAVKKAGQLPMKMYQWEDEVFKLGVFKAERLAGKSPEESLEAANRLFFDYSEVPSGVESLRDTGIIPFISWSYKVIPVVAKTAVDHPERLLAMMYAYKTASDYWYESQYGEKADAQMRLEREVRPDFQKGKLFGVGPDAQLRLKNDGKTGQARTLSVNKYIPGADLFSDFGDSFPFGMHPVVSLIYGMSSNQHAAFGSKILPYAEPKNSFQEAENFDAKMKHLSNTILPNLPFLPYTYSSERLGNLLVSTGDINENSGWLWDYAQRRGWNGKDYFSKDLDVSDEVLNMIGVKINRTDVLQAATTEMRRRAGAFGSAKRELSKVYTDRKSTPGRRKAALQGFTEEQMPENLRKLQDLSTLLQETQ